MKKSILLIGISILIVIVSSYFVYQLIQLPKSINENSKEINFQSDCIMDADCEEYISHNNCNLYCANNENKNNVIISRFKMTCDSTLWDPPFGRDCKCVNNECQFVD